MRLGALCLLALAAIPVQGAVRTYMVKGVTESKGWYDADKAPGQEADLCWAAAASNAIAWWQDRNADTHAQTEAPKGTAVWEMMRKDMPNRPGSPQGGVNWWFSHSLQPGPMGGSDNSKGGFYASIMNGKPLQTELLRAPLFGSDLTLSERIKELIQGGNALCLAIQPVQGRQMQNGSHWISLWGIDYDEDKKVVTRVYVTDPDDAAGQWPSIQKGLLVADCTWAEDIQAGSRTFASLMFRTPQGWYNDNTCITSIVTLNGNSEFAADSDKERNAKADEEQDAQEAKSTAKKGKKLAKPKRDKKAEREEKKREREEKRAAKKKKK